MRRQFGLALRREGCLNTQELVALFVEDAIGIQCAVLNGRDSLSTPLHGAQHGGYQQCEHGKGRDGITRQATTGLPSIWAKATGLPGFMQTRHRSRDRKSTRLNSSH